MHIEDEDVQHTVAARPVHHHAGDACSQHEVLNTSLSSDYTPSAALGRLSRQTGRAPSTLIHACLRSPAALHRWGTGTNALAALVVFFVALLLFYATLVRATSSTQNLSGMSEGQNPADTSPSSSLCARRHPASLRSVFSLELEDPSAHEEDGGLRRNPSAVWPSGSLCARRSSMTPLASVVIALRAA
ncbi:hypothetical protein CALVIDRAFT_186987 [Calocera viscosa TUFC12733]|uniref:Uncharacterized protein n=1 Tax=Calocera viscosa (strain TUFC12733) TaxID=1330018 RepID=A0A167KUD1_CALVF|nr:hypothetical protein CALVIDRAFT_186987 [Calocera viscosa TUFC12733]